MRSDSCLRASILGYGGKPPRESDIYKASTESCDVDRWFRGKKAKARLPLLNPGANEPTVQVVYFLPRPFRMALAGA